MVKVLVVGQTPPPYHGQAIMIGEMLRMRHPGVELIHARMDFSVEIHEVGKVKAGKFLRLISLIASILRIGVTRRPDVLYYPPAGPNMVPVLRDIAILLATRWLFRRTVFHFHAGGLSEIYPRLPVPLRPLFRLAYGKPDAAILLSDLNPPDGAALGARKILVIPYGIEDLRASAPASAGPRVPGPPRILFVGMLCESKGVLVLLEACRRLAERGRDFQVEIMGRFEGPEFERLARERVAAYGLEDRARFLGVLSGAPKAAAFARADIFCFPTFYESETFGVVLLEAMSFGLPLVATRWRGLPSIVADGENGFLAPVRDPGAVADLLDRLLADPALRETLGRKGRRIFEERFSLERYHRDMAETFIALGAG